MIAWAIKDYFGGFRWGRMKEAYKIGGWWGPLYSLTVLPLLTEIYDGWMSAIYFILCFFPVVFCWFSAPLHTMVLPKMMYLCPMSEEQRKEYLVYSMVIRMGIPWLIGIVGAAILFALGMCDWITGLGVVLNETALSLLLGAGINKYGYGAVSVEGQRVMNFETRVGVWESFGVIIGVIFGAIHPIVLAWDTPVPLYGKAVILGIQLLLQVPITLNHMKFWRSALENAVHYESVTK